MPLPLPLPISPRLRLAARIVLCSAARPGRAFSIGQPPGILQPSADGTYRFYQRAGAAEGWSGWLAEQYAALQAVAGDVESFSASSWEGFDTALVPLRLADFLALLPPERLTSVALLLDDAEPLPGPALRALAGQPHALRLVSWAALTAPRCCSPSCCCVQ